MTRAVGRPSNSSALEGPGEPGLAYASLLQVRADWMSFYDAHYLPVIGFVVKNGGVPA